MSGQDYEILWDRMVSVGDYGWLRLWDIFIISQTRKKIIFVRKVTSHKGSRAKRTTSPNHEKSTKSQNREQEYKEQEKEINEEE